MYLGDKSFLSGQNARKQPLKSPLMPTSVTTSTGQVVNLTYNVPNDNPGFLIMRPAKVPSLQPVPVTPISEGVSFTHGSSKFTDLTSPTPPSSLALTGDYFTTLSKATPPFLLSATPIDQPMQHNLTEEELYNDDTLNSNNLELYSPLPHLQFTGHAPNFSFSTTPLEDWIKHPNNVTLSSDTLIASLHPPHEISSNPATPASIFSDTPLPPFSQSSQDIPNITPGFALPPLENTLDFESVDLEGLPP